MEERIGFIGAGQMARALAGGIVAAGLVPANRVLAVDPSGQARDGFAAKIPGVQFCETGPELVRAVDIVIVAVKPNMMERVAQVVREEVSSEKLLVSIAAGITLSRLADSFGSQRIIRVMPNTPSLVGQGAAGYSLGTGASERDALLVKQILESVGIAFSVDESLLDGVTGLSGSGPAYVYTIIEALSDGGVRMGLPRAVATALATQTVLGAATMVSTTGEHPAVLREQVTSPGGTTIAGIAAMERHGVRTGLMEAVVAATQKSVELRGK